MLPFLLLFTSIALADVSQLNPKDFVQAMRAVILSERMTVTPCRSLYTSPPCSTISRFLNKREALNHCNAAADNITLALRGQGVPPSSFRVVSFSEIKSPEALFVGGRTPGHVFILLKAQKQNGEPVFLALDPSNHQFTGETFHNFLDRQVEGRAMLAELRNYGFWVITKERYALLGKAFQEGEKNPTQIKWEDLPHFFEQLSTPNISDAATSPFKPETFTQTLSGITAETIRQRLEGRQPKKPNIPQLPESLITELNRSIQWPGQWPVPTDPN